MERLHIVGGGMAGSEAAWQAAEAGVPVTIHEMRPHVGTFAHHTGDLAEMVCSNSFRSDDHESNAVGLLHWEMRAAGGLVIAMADAHRLPAGGALAVDREPFSRAVTERLRAHPLVAIETGEVAELPRDGRWIVATGPLTSDALAEAIRAETGSDALAFFDAIAPIVHADSIDMDVAWAQSRYDKGATEAERTAYLNCPHGPRALRGVRRCAHRRRHRALPRGRGRLGARAGRRHGCHPLLRRLPADRGHGRARARDAALGGR